MGSSVENNENVEKLPRQSMEDTINDLRKELKSLHEQDLQLLRQLLHINHTINKLTGKRNPYQRSHSSSSISIHKESLTLSQHLQLCHTDTEDLLDEEHLKIAQHLHPINTHKPLVMCKSEPTKDVSQLSPFGPTPKSLFANNFEVDSLASSFSSYTVESELFSDDLSPDVESELSDTLAPLPRTGSQRWRQNSLLDDRKNEMSVTKSGVPNIPASESTIVNNKINQIKEDLKSGNRYQRNSVILNRTRPPLLHTKAVNLDDDEIAVTSNETCEGVETAKGVTAEGCQNGVEQSEPQDTPTICLPSKSSNLTEYEMSYEQFLQKGIQLWKEVQNEKQNLGVVDDKKMTAFTVVMT